MDLSVLRRLVEELENRLVGRRVEQVFALPRHHLSLVVGGRRAPRLWFSAEADEPHVYLRRDSPSAPQPPPAFAMAARRHCRGRRIKAVGLVGEDRVVEVSCESFDSRLVMELVPRRASAFIVDGTGSVVAVWCPRRGRPGVGERYIPPARPARPKPDVLDGATWDRIARSADTAAMARDLLREVGGLDRLSAREVVARHRRGEPLDAAAAAEVDRARSETPCPCVYAPGPLASLSALPPGDRFLLAPYRLAQVGEELTRIEFPTIVEAAAAYYATRARLRRVDALRDGILAGLRRARARFARARARSSQDPTVAADAQRLRKFGDLLLAFPHAAVVDGAIEVPDAHGDGSLIRIPVNPRIGTVGSAEKFYSRARRAERGADRQRRRLAHLDDRDRKFRALEGDLETCGSLASYERVLSEARAEGVDVRVRGGDDPEAKTSQAGSRVAPANDAAAGSVAPVAGPVTPSTTPAGDGWQRHGAGFRRAVEPGIVAYRTAADCEILVGRNAAANDRLTHRLARPDDWWLHARGPGAHVVLRNPTGTEEPPHDELAVAASIAAWFSDARNATKVNVDWTRARDVRRPRRRPPGTAMLRSHRTLLAIPAKPDEVL